MHGRFKFGGLSFFGLCLIFTLTEGMVLGQTNGRRPKEIAAFFVNADCPMCEKRIEAAADLKGVVKADFDLDSYTMTVVFKPKKITLLQIQTGIAEAGYDTETIRAKDEDYGRLPGCCQYKRIDKK